MHVLDVIRYVLRRVFVGAKDGEEVCRPPHGKSKAFDGAGEVPTCVRLGATYERLPSATEQATSIHHTITLYSKHVVVLLYHLCAPRCSSKNNDVDPGNSPHPPGAQERRCCGSCGHKGLTESLPLASWWGYEVFLLFTPPIENSRAIASSSSSLSSPLPLPLPAEDEPLSSKSWIPVEPGVSSSADSCPRGVCM